MKDRVRCGAPVICGDWQARGWWMQSCDGKLLVRRKELLSICRARTQALLDKTWQLLSGFGHNRIYPAVYDMLTFIYMQ